MFVAFHSGPLVQSRKCEPLEKVNEALHKIVISPENFPVLSFTIIHPLIVQESDSNKDGRLTKGEILDQQDLWVGSAATEYNRHDPGEL